MAFTKELRDKTFYEICDLYKSGQYTLISCLDAKGIHNSTFYRWLKEHEEYRDYYNKTLDDRKLTKYDRLKEIALCGLEMLLRPTQVRETTREEMPFLVKNKDGSEEIIIKYKTTTKIKTLMPNATAVIFALANLDSSNFKNNKDDGGSDKSNQPIDIKEREQVLDEMIQQAQDEQTDK